MEFLSLTRKDLITDDLCRQKATTFQPTPDVVSSRGTVSLSFFLNFQRLDGICVELQEAFLKHLANGLPLLLKAALRQPMLSGALRLMHCSST